MNDKFEKLASIKKRDDVEKNVALKFKERQARREKAYQARAKSQSPSELFYARSYNL
jgi:hypothetical protein